MQRQAIYVDKCNLKESLHILKDLASGDIEHVIVKILFEICIIYIEIISYYRSI